MLRTIRITAPAERFEELKAAARHAALGLADYCIDTNPDARWPWAGDGRAAVLAIADDEHESEHDVLAAVRTAYEATSPYPASELALGGKYVMWPDGCSIETYQFLDGPTCELHTAEAALAAATAAGDTAAADDAAADIARLRDVLRIPLAQAFEHGAAVWEDFAEQVTELLGLDRSAPVIEL